MIDKLVTSCGPGIAGAVLFMPVHLISEHCSSFYLPILKIFDFGKQLISDIFQSDRLPRNQINALLNFSMP